MPLELLVINVCNVHSSLITHTFCYIPSVWPAWKLPGPCFAPELSLIQFSPPPQLPTSMDTLCPLGYLWLALSGWSYYQVLGGGPHQPLLSSWVPTQGLSFTDTLWTHCKDFLMVSLLLMFTFLSVAPLPLASHGVCSLRHSTLP